MSTTPRPVIGIFGAGKVGTALARLAIDAGYTVHIASSGTAADTAGITPFFAPGALAGDGRDLPGLTDVLIIAVPLRRFRELPLAAMDGHIVVDVMNYWPPIDGTLDEFESTDRPTSTIVDRLKVINHHRGPRRVLRRGRGRPGSAPRHRGRGDRGAEVAHGRTRRSGHATRMSRPTTFLPTSPRPDPRQATTTRWTPRRCDGPAVS